MEKIIFRLAHNDDVSMIARLVNSAYRGASSEQGWTSEAHLLDGQRIDEAMLQALLAEPKVEIHLGFIKNQLVCCAELRKEDDYAYLGMVTVDPLMQGRGVGNSLLNHCESYIQRDWQKDKIQISVLVPRSELIQYYVSRGFRPVGRRWPFPTDTRYGCPKVDGLELEVYEKVIDAVF